MAARIRTIKPDFFTSEDVVALSPMARLCFIALLCAADREGRLEWRPVTIKLRFFPADNVDIDALASEIEARGMLARYEADGTGYAQVVNFTKHQVVNNREAASIIPAPPADLACPTRQDACLTRGPRVLTRGPQKSPTLSGREGKGKEHTHTRASRVRDATDDARFARFWSAYPKKVAKADAYKAWNKLTPDEALTDRIVAAVNTATGTEAWRKDDGQFIPHPATFLRGRRFDDEVVPPVASGIANRSRRVAGL